MKKASLIIMRPYDSEGVMWEFEQIIKHGYLAKTFLYVKWSSEENNISHMHFLNFRNKILERFNIFIGDYNPEAPIIFFDNNCEAWETNDYFDIPSFRKIFYHQYLIPKQQIKAVV
jgi:hypothetical protein